MLSRYDLLEAISDHDRIALWKAWDRHHGKPVALKIITLDPGEDRKVAIRESTSALAMKPHEGIATLRYDFMLDDRYVMVLDWIDGQNLDSVLREQGAPGLPYRTVLDYVGQVASALDHLHRHDPPIVHGDVKPANLMLRPDGRVVLVDFGAVATAEEGIREATPGYTAPEVAGGVSLTPAADVYALAATTVTLLTGRAPDSRRPLFEGIDPSDVAALTATLRRALASDPALRPASAGRFAEQLTAAGQTPWTGVLAFLAVSIVDLGALLASESADSVLDTFDDQFAGVVADTGGRALAAMAGGETRFAVFRDSAHAAAAAVRLQHEVERGIWPRGVEVAVRAAVDVGPVEMRRGSYEGPAVLNAARIAAVVPGGCAAVSSAAAELIGPRVPDGMELVPVGPQLFGLVALGSRPFSLLASAGPRHVLTLCAQFDAVDEERCRGLVADAANRFDGRVLSVDGMEAIVLFGGAGQAAEAALALVAGAARVALHAEPTLVRARGDVPVTTYTSRMLCRTASSGQILVSEAAHAAVAAALPADSRLEPAGIHTVNDLGEPQPVYELTRQRRADRRNDLPARAGRLIGREVEVDRLVASLATTRMCTVVGAAGVGKSRLAHEAAAAAASFRGAWVVDLAHAGTDLAAHVLAGIGRGQSGSGTFVGRQTDDGPSTLSSLVEHLSDEQALLVLDNCDALRAEVATLADTLVRRCVGVTVLATCREPIGVDGESLMRLRPFDLPRPDDAPAVARENPAVALFLERARSGRPDLAVDEAAITTISTICRAADGLPLAIELAAARAKHQSLTSIAAAIGAGLDGFIEWSYAALDDDTQAALNLLSVFVGGFTAAAAGSVAADSGLAIDVRACLDDLVDKSLIEVDLSAQPERYRLLEVTRRFAESRLDRSGSRAGVHAAHAAWCERFGLQAENGLSGRDQARWLRLVDLEYDNLRAAANRSPTAGLAIGGRLALYWLVSGRITEGRGWLDGCLRNTSGAPLVSVAAAWAAAAWLACFDGDYEDAVVASGRAWRTCNASGDPGLRARAAIVLGMVALMRNLPAHAVARNASAVALSREAGVSWLTALALTNLGNAHLRGGDVTQARAAYMEALSLRRARGDAYGLTWTLLRHGVLVAAAGDPVTGRELLTEAIGHADEIGYQAGSLLATLSLADVCLDQPDALAAERAYLRALDLARNLEDHTAEGLALAGLAALAGADDRRDEAARWAAEHEEIGLGSGIVAALSLLRTRAAVARSNGFDAEAAALHRGALLLAWQVGDARGVAAELAALAACARRFGDEPRAAALTEAPRPVGSAVIATAFGVARG